jgi:heme exporter protein C
MQPAPRSLKALSWISGLLFIGALLMALFYAPREAVMGDVQRVFYFHVASGWVGALSFLVAAAAGVIFLVRGGRRWDAIGLGSVEIGVVFSLATVISGSVWARPIWNTWWTWDPRLTTAAIMELIYAAYLLLRQGIEEPERRARFGAVYAIVGFVSVPLTFISIRIFRTIHPVIIGSNDPTAQGTFEMAPSMLRAFIFSLVTFSFVYIDLFWHRLRLAKLADAVEQLKLKASQ